MTSPPGKCPVARLLYSPLGMSRTSQRRSWEILQETMEKEYSKELLASKKNRTVNWDFARNAVKRLESILSSDSEDLLSSSGLHVFTENYLHTEGKFWKIFEFLMNSFDTLELPDTTIASDLLHLAYRSLYFEHNAIPNGITDEIRYAWDLAMNEGGIRGFRMLLKAAYSGHDKKQGYDYFGNVVWHFIARGNEKILSSLLRYGVMFVRMEDRDNMSSVEYLLFVNRDERPPEGWMWFYSDIKTRGERLTIVSRVTQLLALELGCTERPHGQGPYSEQCSEDGSLSHSVYFRCLQRTFETIPEPFVTSDEIRCYLQEMLSIYWNEERDRYINSLISDFEDLYPEGAGILSPRSLQHLSRCQVRENLRQSGTLPHRVRELKLPRNIEKYIILE